MLLTDDEIQERISSPMNLLNRLRTATTPRSAAEIPCLPPTSSDLNLDIEGKLAAGKLRDTAANIMGLTLLELQQRIPDIQKPEKLAQIATEMNKIVQSRQDEGKKAAQIIVYAPQVIQENHFQELTLVDDI